MSDVRVEKCEDAARPNLPVFEDFAKRMEAVRKRAHELFQFRGGAFGRELDDWFAAEREMFGWTPAEFIEKDGAFEVAFALPGFDAKDMQVTVASGEIFVRAVKSAENKCENEKVHWSEFGSNEVCRRFELPAAADTANVTATLEKGVLRIKAPKAVFAQPRKIGVAKAA